MFKLWLWLALIAVGCRGFSYNDNSDAGWYEDYWYDDDDAIDKAFDAVKSTVATSDATKTSPTYEEPKDDVPGINDYQLEDNRSELEDDYNSDSKNSGENVKDSSEKTNNVDVIAASSEADKKTLDDPTDTSTHKIEPVEKYDDVAYMSSDSERKILEETEAILQEDTKASEENDFGEFAFDEKNENADVDQMIDETSKLLDGTSDLLEDPIEDDKKADVEEINNESSLLENTSKEVQETAEEDTVDKAFNDLMSDLDKLQKTWGKLRDYDDENVQSSEIGENGSYDYEEVDDDHLDQLFSKSAEFGKENEGKEIDNDEKEIVNAEEDISKSTFQETQNLNRMSEPILYLNDALMASETESRKSTTEQNGNNVQTTAIPEISIETTSTLGSILTTEVEKTENTENIENDEDQVEAVADVEDFTADRKYINFTAADARNAIEVRLTIDTPVVVTSPNYPQRYPTGPAIDWMIVGDGMGIELNVTDFDVNGIAGHYLYIKPGGYDMSGSDGILFTHTVNSEKRYRFMDVDRMFMRFEAARGMSFSRGFRLSMRMVGPRPGAPIEEPVPEPEAVIPTPPATITLNLGGVSLEDFIQVEERFRVILADMATLYINTHNIDPGMNTTLETTQITSKALCFHNWPKFELCAEVRFGVPIVYEEEEDADDADEKREPRLNEEDLRDMWESYSQRDPFAVRLRMLGITEYQVPNDRGVLTIWLVIAGGVVISMAMLAFALWRFSCFADYTRMPSFSDTDSIKEKRNLDLYPTPHQTLPPLYTETDYKWADAKYDEAKMDIGGYSNRSYMRNDIYDIDSDEDVMTPRDRGSGISPRDIYNV